jgi:hypothetical protein
LSKKNDPRDDGSVIARFTGLPTDFEMENSLAASASSNRHSMDATKETYSQNSFHLQAYNKNNKITYIDFFDVDSQDIKTATVSF